jgi:hypothetical protein
MPVPAAAVTTTTLPSRRSVTTRIGGPIAGWSRSKGSLRLRRKSEHSLGDDVPLDLVRSSVDRVRAAEQEQCLELGQFVRRRQRPSSSCPLTSIASSPRSRCQVPQKSFEIDASGVDNGPSSPLKRSQRVHPEDRSVSQAFASR